MKSNLQNRYVPEGYTAFKPGLGDYPKDLFACYVKIDLGANSKFSAIFYTGKQSKSTWHYSFSSEDRMKEKIKETVSRLMSWEDMKAERKAARNAVAMVGIGSIFSTSWGYNMTNVEFLQVVKETAHMVWFEEIGQEETHTGFLSGTTVPTPGQFLLRDGKRTVYQARKRNSGSEVYFTFKERQGGYGRSASKWTGRPCHFNHCD